MHVAHGRFYGHFELNKLYCCMVVAVFSRCTMLSRCSGVARTKNVERAVVLLRHVASTKSNADDFNVVRSSGISTSALLQEKKQMGRENVTKKVNIDGVDISYNVTGCGKHTLFLFPGALGSVKTDFMYQMENYNKDLFTLIGWDPPGYGNSIPPNRDWPRHFFGRDADMAVKMLQALGIEKCSLLGWSDGATTAIMVAARCPEKIRKLVIWGGAAFVTEEELPDFEKVRNIDAWNAEMRNSFLTVYKEDYLRREFSNWVDAYKRYRTEGDGDICKAEVDRITCPTLILHGAKDPLVPNFHPEYLVKNIRNSKLHTFPEGRHNIHQHVRSCKEFRSIVESFLILPE